MSARDTIQRRSPRRILLLLVLSAPLLGGCQSWRASPLAPRSLIAEERPRVLRVTLADGSRATLSEPRVVADTIVGTVEGTTHRAAVGDLRMIEVRRTSYPRTVGLVVAHLAIVFTFVAVVIDVQPHYRGF